MTRPPGNLFWLSILWGISAVAGIVLSIKAGIVVLGVICAAGLLATVGLWFQSRIARYVLMAWFSMAILLALLLFFVKGFDSHYILRMMVSAYFVYELARNQED